MTVKDVLLGIILVLLAVMFYQNRADDNSQQWQPTIRLATIEPPTWPTNPPGLPLETWTATPSPPPSVGPNDEPQSVVALTPAATNTPEPTRPAIEQLPLGEGPYDAWAQRLQGELNTHQFGYCKGVVEKGQ